MKITTEQLRNIYLEDLKRPDVHHGRDKAKVHNIAPWRDMVPYSKTGTFVDLSDKFYTKGSTIFVWSDIHFGHQNIIKYCNRPFRDKDHMTQQMLTNYQNIIGDNDIVIFGGDIGFMKEPAINSLLDQMPGYKIQILGNHDLHRDGSLYNLNFDERHLCFPLYIPDITMVSGSVKSFTLLFTHYPLDTIPDDCINVHGHIHDRLVGDRLHLNMCVEHTKYQPKSLALHFGEHILKHGL